MSDETEFCEYTLRNWPIYTGFSVFARSIATTRSGYPSNGHCQARPSYVTSRLPSNAANQKEIKHRFA
jgi:hypothetical protein